MEAARDAGKMATQLTSLSSGLMKGEDINKFSRDTIYMYMYICIFKFIQISFPEDTRTYQIHSILQSK